ncbi:MAG: hypothetical protein GY792_35845 [Gammaproteobacteria bacterium]|nr:hypothetical protein [Gammaproteobacteria bacterium]
MIVVVEYRIDREWFYFYPHQVVENGTVEIVNSSFGAYPMDAQTDQNSFLGQQVSDCIACSGNYIAVVSGTGLQPASQSSPAVSPPSVRPVHLPQ